MTRLGLSRQLWLAFGALLAIMTVAGALAAWRMFSVDRQFGSRSGQHLPEVVISASIERSVLEAMLAIRAYGMTGQASHLEEGRAHIAKVKEALNEADRLLQQNANLQGLAEHVSPARKSLVAYEKLLGETVSRMERSVAIRASLTEAGTTFSEECESYHHGQIKLAGEELAAQANQEAVSERVAKLDLMGKIQANGHQIRVLALNAQIDNRYGDLQKLDALFAEFDDDLRALVPLTHRDEHQEKLAAVKLAAAAYRSALSDLRANSEETAKVNAERNAAAEEVIQAARAAAATGMGHTEEVIGRATAALSTMAWGLLIGLVAVLALGLLMAAVLTRRISSPLLEGSNVLASAANEISATVAQIASSATQTATSVQETTTTVDEVRQTARLASDKAKAVQTSAQAADEAAQAGRGATAKCLDGMKLIARQMSTIAEGILRLNEQSQAIGDITATVGDLAEQSNLLAVNASIEAAKAGEQGLGFAVVAQEIRRLAEQSKEATVSIRTILNDIQKATTNAVLSTERGSKAVDEGLALVERAGEIIESLAACVEEAAAAATQISASSQQQLVGMEQVASAMGGIQQASSQSQDSTRQLTVAAQNLRQLGERLRVLIEGIA